MRTMLSRLRIENFRKFDRFAIEFGRRNLLVGPNNAGKSTVIEALRLVSMVVNRLPNLNIERPPDWLAGSAAAHGVYPSLRGLDFDLGRETFHQYSDPPATVTAELSSGLQIVVHAGPGGKIFGIARDSDGVAIQTKREARQLNLERVGIQPQVGPVAKVERPLRDRYVRGALDSSLAPTHFRNQLRLLEDYFEDFKLAAERSWPGLVIDGLEALGLGEDRHLALFLRDGPFVGELAAMGHGLQMWLQLMWFLARAQDDATIVLDEPDVYMHPDLQRRLIRFLFKRDQQVIVATHSVEMMAEVEPDELLPIDGAGTKARPARKVADIQRVVDQVGGIHNIQFARLARADRCLVVPPGELRILSRWYDLVAPAEHGALDLLPAFPCAGWTDWPYVIATKRAVDQLRDDPIRMLCLIPGGRVPEDVFEPKRREAADEGIDLCIWSHRDLESYALDPYVIERVLSAANEAPGATKAAAQLDAIADTLRNDARTYGEQLALALGTTLDSERWLTRIWSSPRGRLSVIPGRLAVLRLSAWAHREYGQRLGLRDLVGGFRAEDLDPQVDAVLRALAAGEALSEIPESDAERPWPTSNGEPSVGNEARVSEVLDLFEAAGIFE